MIGLNAGRAHAGIKAEHEQVVVRSLGHQAMSFMLLADGSSPGRLIVPWTGGFVFIFHGGKVGLFPPGPFTAGPKKAPPVWHRRGKDE